MTSFDELRTTIETALTLAGTDVRTIERRPDSTIVPDRLSDTAGRRAFAMLNELASARTSSLLELHGTIGEGGMGIVRVGTQRSLGRSVAVKTLKDEHVGDETTLKLLREAWVTGSLEHPNVVPVYDIALDPGGRPQIILKKIEGDEWGELMHDERAIQTRFGAADPLEWNLRILMQVCNAVRFAHSRGILHRDLKPENVMIGAFGEVYVVDWGIAVSTIDDGTGRVPLASEAKQIAGTPVYMAPEMLGGPVSKLSERSDVYLLGSILYEICVGEPPHRGEAFMELVASIVDSQPAIPDEVPAELARIIRHAMRADPDARFENVEQLRLALSAFLSHRDGVRLALRAEERLAELSLVIEEAAGPNGFEARDRIAPLFSECRFGFRHALEVWPQNELARRGLHRALVAMTEHELEEGRASHARALLAEMDEPSEELAARVSAAVREEAEERARLENLSAQHDPQKGRRTRAFVAGLVGIQWTIAPVVFHFVFADRELAQVHLLLFSIVMLALIGGLGFWARESMMGTAINRIISVSAVLVMGVQILASIGGEVLGRSAYDTLHEQFIVWVSLTAIIGVAIERRFLLVTLTYVVSYVVLSFVGTSHVFLVMAVSNAVMPLVAYTSWGRLNEDLDAARQRIEERQRERRQRWTERKERRAALRSR